MVRLVVLYGGLVLYYQNENKVELNYLSLYFVDVIFMNENNVDWRFTGFYGHPAWNEKHLSWSDLRTLHSNASYPWVVLGDFNEIMYSHEKDGGNPRPNAMMQEFRNCLGDCGLYDLGYAGDYFTWRRGEIRERLDRVVCNVEW